MQELLSAEKPIVAFCEACAHGHLQVAKFLYAETPSLLPDDNIINALRGASYNNQLEICKWMFSLTPDMFQSNDLNHSEVLMEMFRAAMSAKHLEMANWLFDLKIKNGRVIHVNQIDMKWFLNRMYCILGIALVQSCRNGDVLVVESLLPKMAISSFTNGYYSFYNDAVFMAAFVTCRYDILRLLLSIKQPGHVFYLEDRWDWFFGEGNVVAVKLRWMRRKYALWMRRGCAKTNTLFRQIPEDVSRYIIQSFL